MVLRFVELTLAVGFRAQAHSLLLKMTDARNTDAPASSGMNSMAVRGLYRHAFARFTQIEHCGREAYAGADNRERVALAWAESVTRAAETGVPDADYAAAAAEFSDKELADLTYAIGLMNVFNRLGITSARPRFNARPVLKRLDPHLRQWITPDAFPCLSLPSNPTWSSRLANQQTEMQLWHGHYLASLAFSKSDLRSA
jgi:hypothetical protein